jgi:dihydroflavonol-4-reductase
MIVAVTGASGHVGVNLCQTLISKGYKVRALIHSHSTGLSDLPVEQISGDVLNNSTLTPLMKGADVVFHLAARISINGDPDGSVRQTNTVGTHNMLKAATEFGVSRFIHFSSIHAISQHPLKEQLDENRPLVSDHGYAYDRSKADGERLVLAASMKGLNAIVLSPTAILGPLDPEPSLSGQAVADICNRKIPSLVPGGYDWVDVRDVVDAAINAIDQGRPGEKYILSGQWASLVEFSGYISNITGQKTNLHVIPMWVAHAGLPFISAFSKLTRQKPLYTRESLQAISEGNKLISNQKAREELAFNPRPLEESLRDLIHYLTTKKLIK